MKEEIIKQLISFVKEIEENYEHDAQTKQHQPFHYGGTCLLCEAERLLRLINEK
jgi:hypothetical protein